MRWPADHRWHQTRLHQTTSLGPAFSSSVIPTCFAEAFAFVIGVVKPTARAAARAETGLKAASSIARPVLIQRRPLVKTRAWPVTAAARTRWSFGIPPGAAARANHDDASFASPGLSQGGEAWCRWFWLRRCLRWAAGA